MLVEIYEGFFCDPEEVAVVKTTGKDMCAVFTQGQSAMDGGFALPYAAEEVAAHVNDAIENMYEEGEGEDG